MKKYIIISFLAAAVCFSSCNDWLDVKPTTTVNEGDLFSDEFGFMEALAGVYIKMGSTGLYAKDLSYGFIDILGQRYEYSNYNNADYYTFPSSTTEGYTKGLWSRMYNEIANLNNMLQWMDKNGHVFKTPDYYEIMRGEATALRAFLHFDLLRMYGPVYKNDPTDARISYRREFGKEAMEAMASDKVIQEIVKDLEEAHGYLEGSDPLDFDFPRYEYYTPANTFLTLRHKRMNLYAVKAMLARVHLYAGNKTAAARYASEVVDSRIFSLVEDNQVDPMRSTEIIFSVYVDKFHEIVNPDFFESGKPFRVRTQKFLDEMFNVAGDGANDTRRAGGSAFLDDAFGFYSTKYRQSAIEWESAKNTVPLIRLPEMYYILAECETDLGEAEKRLNKVRESRRIDPLILVTEAQKQNAIESEYRKEFYGEGQLFYFYKRHFYTSFLHCPVPEMTDENYIFNIPDDEITFGKTNQ